MKYVTNLCLLFFTTNTLATPIRIFHERKFSNAQTIKEIFIKNYQIPEELIIIKEIERCGGLKEKGKLDLCLKKNGDLFVVSVDRRFISESLKIFQAP